MHTPLISPIHLMPIEEETTEPARTMEPLPRRRQRRRAATSMEYLVMLSFILLVVIVGIQSFGNSVAALFKVDANATSKTPTP